MLLFHRIVAVCICVYQYTEAKITDAVTCGSVVKLLQVCTRAPTRPPLMPPDSGVAQCASALARRQVRQWQWTTECDGRAEQGRS